MLEALIERLKRFVRALEARLTPRKHRVTHRGSALTFVRSRWWDDAFQESFDREIEPYFAALPADFTPRTIIDAGAATGLFAVAACKRYPGVKVHAFEPSERQRIVLRRNARSNGVAERVQVNSFGLWDSGAELSFRTHGAISAFQAAGSLPSTLPFSERVPVVPLDAWVKEAGVGRVDLIKMDVEGAEIEALAGATETLRRDNPVLLVQAYHVREGTRTFERCAAQLGEHGYRVDEIQPPSGFLRAFRRE